MNNTQECPICKNDLYAQQDFQRDVVFFDCPVCGRFEYGIDDSTSLNDNHLAPFLFHNAFKGKRGKTDLRYHTTLSREKCDEYKKGFEQGDYSHGLPVHMDSDIIETWYPKTFAERVDCVLLYISAHTEHLGQQLSFPFYSMLSLLFVDRKEWDSFTRKKIWRNNIECKAEAEYLLNYLSENAFVSYEFGSPNENTLLITLSPKGYARVDEIQKETSYGKSVLVAMKFGDDTIPLREAIRKGITEAGYVAVFIDEVQHNDFITPELLKHIRDSKFVVADLTHQNNGAYFEEGYAMGLGKPVIQLCKKGVKLHFDIAQKNTIMWESEDDIPLRLTNRIKATID